MNTRASNCIYCKKATNDESKFGKFYKVDGITAHYYCVLLSYGLVQAGRDRDGILGFLPHHIMENVMQHQLDPCVYCRNKGANLKCLQCDRKFHLPCLYEHKGCPVFDPHYSSLCHVHYKHNKPTKNHTYNWLCVVCLDQITRADFENFDNRPLILPCCEFNMIHFSCARELVDNAGYFSKCPFCQNSQKFKEFMSSNGIKVDHRDSTWNDANIVEVPRPVPITLCEARTCICLQGREFTNTGKYSFLRCKYCGSKGAHIVCTSGKFICGECFPVIQKVTESSKIECRQTAPVASSSSHETKQKKLGNIKKYHVIRNRLQLESRSLVYIKHGLRSGRSYNPK